MKNGTKSFSLMDLDIMQDGFAPKAHKAWRRIPYHLQYVRDGKINNKPEEKDGFKKTL
jgi:hypothetical protein